MQLVQSAGKHLQLVLKSAGKHVAGATQRQKIVPCANLLFSIILIKRDKHSTTSAKKSGKT